jgi:hypothetical protein
MRVSPIESAPNISARWEMDLSPGTRMRPDSGPDLMAASIGIGEAEVRLAKFLQLSAFSSTP